MGDEGTRRDGSSLTWREAVLGVLVGAAVLGFGLAAAVQTQRLVADDRAEADRIAVASTSAGVAADLERALAQVGDAADRIPVFGVAAATGPRAATLVPGATKVGYLAADPASGGPTDVVTA